MELDSKSNEKDSNEFARSMERLITTIQKLSLARDLDTIISIVRKEARDLTGADGATFVLRDNGFCYYAEENAISPLWKGKRFPMEACISGWAMLNKQSVAIKDVYQDSRIPIEAYRPTFVKSLLMVPIRKESPIGAIGNYWSKEYEPSVDKIKLLEALANSTSIAMENVDLYHTQEIHLTEIAQQKEKYRLLAESLKESLSEKEILLKEIYHRVKNNLQIISSLLDLQADKVQSDALKSVLSECSMRINAMCIVHELLYQSDNLARIYISDYINNLVNYFYGIYDISTNRVINSVDVDDILFSLDTAIPCGLIVTELLSNCFKHAFPDNKSGKISIAFKKNQDKSILTIRDDGVGLPKEAELENKKTLGLSLVRNLSKQLHGDLQIDRNNGTAFILTLPYTSK
jgi:two-component sensor histidine kinase